MPIFKDSKGTKDGRKYYFTAYYDDTSGKRKLYKSKKYLTPKEAKKAESTFLLNTNEYNLNSLNFNVLLDEYCDDYKRKNKTSSYYTLYKRVYKYLVPNFNKDISKINVNDLNNFKKKMDDQNLSPSYKNNIIMYFRSIIKYGKRKYDIITNIDEKIDNYTDRSSVKDVDFWTYEEWEVFDKSLDDLMYKAFFNILYFCGLRKCEALALKWDKIEEVYISIDPKEGNVNYKKTDGGWELTPPKTKKSIRKVSMPNKVIALLKKLKLEKESYTDFKETLFIFGDIRPLPLTTLQRKFEYYIDIIKSTNENFKTIRIHDLRHSAVSLLINKNQDEHSIADRMGHSVEMVRNVYSHLFPEKRDKLLEVLNDLDKSLPKSLPRKNKKP